jgi:hypothetical protein
VSLTLNSGVPKGIRRMLGGVAARSRPLHGLRAGGGQHESVWLPTGRSQTAEIAFVESNSYRFENINSLEPA